MSKKALIVLAKGFEEIETITPIDILRRANIEVVVAGLDPATPVVTGSRGISIQTDAFLDELTDDFDACILPGGPGVRELSKSKTVQSLIVSMNSNDKLIAAICAAPARVLAPLGVLDGKKATCYLDMENYFSDKTTFVPEPVVIDGNIITSRGPGTAMAFSLAIVEYLVGQETAHNIKTKTVTN